MLEYNSQADWCIYNMQNCSLDDKSMKFGTQVEDTIRKSFGYRALTDSYFDPKRPTNTIIVIAFVGHFGSKGKSARAL